MLCVAIWPAAAQTIGGNAVFNFLRLPSTPLVTGMGGINISETSNDLGMVMENPALLSEQMNTQLMTGFSTGFNGLNAYAAAGAWHHERSETRLALGLHYLDYGSLTETDASGNNLGIFRPQDWVLRFSMARSYKSKWNYGASLQYIQSSYGVYRANGLAMTIGLQFLDTSRGWSVGLVARNMGTTLRSYSGQGGDDLPFDLQLGFTKSLSNAPFSFSVTAHHLHRLALGYNDVAFDNQAGWSTSNEEKLSLDNLFRHLVLATHVDIGEYLQADLGFNYLRRRELQIGQGGNGLAGFSLGLSLKARRFQLRYARSQYQRSTGYHHFGLNIAMDKLQGL